MSQIERNAGPADVGNWLWKHKGEIGFWVGTGALLLSLPLAGGAASAATGGRLAGRGAAIAARIARSGNVGASAVNAARGGASMVRTARTALAATRAGGALSRVAGSIHAGRVALGSTSVGRAMLAAQRPVTIAGTAIAGVNFADTAVRFSRGEASGRDLVLSSLAVAPVGVAGVRGMAARRAANANQAAARVAATGLDDVAAKAAGATDEVGYVASVAPAVNAPRTAGAAAQAREEAASTLDKAIRLRERATLTSRAVDADDAISASTLARELDDVAARARTARARAADAEELAPDALVPTAGEARHRLGDAEAVAARTRRDIASLATTQQRADRLADSAERVEEAIGTTSLHAANVNNGIRAFDDDRMSLSNGNFARGVLSWMLGRNARIRPPTGVAG